MTKALGLLSFEYHNYNVEGLADSRPISAISMLGRYRIIDFMLSNFTNSGIDNIHVFIKERPRSIIQHIQRTNYNINSKRGGIRLFHGEKDLKSPIYNNDIASYLSNMQFIEEVNAPYVVIAPAHFIYTINFQDVINAHIKNNNDITVVYYNCDDAKEKFIGCDILNFGINHRIKGIEDNIGKYKSRSISLECYVLSKSLFIDLVKKANELSSFFWFKDIVKDSLKDLNVYGYQYKGYASCMNSLKSYYDTSMELSRPEVASNVLKKTWPIYTMTNDSCPTLYKDKGKASGSVIGNGCIIEGEVINSIIGRNVVVKKGAVIKNSIILPSALINKGCLIENAIVDRYAIVTHVKTLKGSKDKPIYVKRGDRI